MHNSFSELDNGTMTRVWIKREPTGFPIHIYTWSSLNEKRSDGFINSTKLPPPGDEELMIVSKVGATLYNFDKLLADLFIKTDSNEYLPLAAEYNNDVVDYTIDTYFESMFFHQFGKYSMKQGRQDADGTPNTVNRAQKLDAVPPQRYRVGSGA